jgi:IclR family acetate operon transcriptional repressor
VQQDDAATMPEGGDPLARLVGSERVLAILAELAVHADGIGLDDLARTVNSPKPTVHRALVALRRAGFATQDGHGHYVLGDEFLRLAFAHHELRPDHVRVRPALLALAERFGETSHYAVLSDRSVVYRAKVDPAVGAARLTSTIGGRNPAHSTAVGKMLLAHALPHDEAVHDWAGPGHLEARTEHTIVEPARLCAELSTVREHGFAIENQENEIGISCLAVPVWLTSPSQPSGAISVSGLTYRTPLEALVQAAEEIVSIVTSTTGSPLR